jgi:hypothetical protein
MIEQWKPIPGYEGLYEVSDQGRVKSTFRYRKILKSTVNRYGYQYVSLKGKKYTVHTLVLLAFVGQKVSETCVCLHGDDNRANNSLTNLRWGTVKQNSEDMVLKGRSLTGDRNHQAKLTEADVWGAHVSRLFGASYSTIAKMLGVSHTAIGYIINGKTWKHVYAELFTQT